MKLSIKYLKTNPYNQYEEEVSEGTEFGFWRVVEYTGAGWFPWPEHYETKEQAAARIIREQENKK